MDATFTEDPAANCDVCRRIQEQNLSDFKVSDTVVCVYLSGHFSKRELQHIIKHMDERSGAVP